MDGTKTTTNWIIAGLVALVVIIGGGWLIARDRAGTMADTTTSTASEASPAEAGEAASPSAPLTGTPTPPPTTRPSTPDVTAASSGETVTVMDQPASANVMVADVKLTKPSFVAVRDTRGWYPGWQFVSASQSSVVIPLKRNTEAGNTYEVVIFIDDGDGTFELHGGDTLVVSSQGAPVSSTFTAK